MQRVASIDTQLLPSVTLRFSPFITFLLLFFLSIDSLPLPIQAQITPLTSLLALLFLPFTITCLRVTPLLKIVIFFVVYALLHSVIALFIDLTALGAEEVRVFAWARQVIALLIGLSVFLVLRRILVSVSEQFIISAVIAGALPVLAIALLICCGG